MKKALIYCYHMPTHNVANGIRLIHFAHMLRELGYTVELHGVGTENGCVYEEEGIRSYTFSELKGHGFSAHFKRKQNHLNYVKKSVEGIGEGDLIISAFNSTELYAHKFLYKYAKQHRVSFVRSLVEWYNIHNYGYKYFYRFLYCEYVMRFVNRKSKNVISISTYLEKYYRRQGCNSLFIPTIVDREAYADGVHTPNERVTVLYAGSPARKDCIMNAIYALGELTSQERARIRFRIYGVKEGQLKALGLTDEFLSCVGDSLEICGRVPQAEIKAQIYAADYTVLLRENTRNANAGFSTKVGESMACGTPVIANHTGDLADYIIDGKTGIVCESETVESCTKAYRRALELSADAYLQLREGSRQVALDAFDYRNYIGAMDAFLKNIKIR
ncbi:MAG: glycosyltransferase family 4 protein [Ruminococcaceae bacterium]|nr:glycosyltransferase family 4 protein [Oscillospiraceae bacterium]